MDLRRAQHDPLGDRQVPDQRPGFDRGRQSRLGGGPPQAREHAEDDREEHDAAVDVAALPARSRDGDARKRRVLRNQARHDVTLLGSAFAYRARMTSSSGASSMAMSLIAACRTAASTT